MGDAQDDFPGKERKKPYAGARKLARKRDSWEERREKKKGKKN